MYCAAGTNATAAANAGAPFEAGARCYLVTLPRDGRSSVRLFFRYSEKVVVIRPGPKDALKGFATAHGEAWPDMGTMACGAFKTRIANLRLVLEVVCIGRETSAVEFDS